MRKLQGKMLDVTEDKAPRADLSEQDIVPLIRRGTVVFLALIWAVAALAAVVAVWLLLTRAVSQTQATALGLEQYARRNIEISAFVADEFARYLDRVGQEKAVQGDSSAADELRRLTDRLPAGSGAIFVLADGTVTLSTSPLPAAPLNLSDRRWFEAHVKDKLKSYVGPAIHSRVIDRIVYTYTQSYFGRDGRLLGIIDLGIPSDSIIGLAPNLDRMGIALLQHEGPLVAAQPISDAFLSRSFALPGMAPAEDTTVLGTAFGFLSIATVRNLPDHRLYAMAAVPLLSVLKPAIWGVAAGFAVLLLLSLALLKLSQLAQQKSQEVAQALADNKVLFQEVHHRVKNNLQVISSLIRLQTDRLPEELKPLMEQTAARVRAIAMVHEQIYMAAKPSEVQLDVFLKKLLEHLAESLMTQSGAGFSVKLEPVTVGLDRAVPVALLATEAITNAIKHGGNGKGDPITIALAREAEMLVLRVVNSGALGEADGKAGLGSRIMTVLARQIEGRWSLEPASPAGTCFTLSWPAAESSGRARPSGDA